MNKSQTRMNYTVQGSTAVKKIKKYRLNDL